MNNIGQLVNLTAVVLFIRILICFILHRTFRHVRYHQCWWNSPIYVLLHFCGNSLHAFLEIFEIFAQIIGKTLTWKTEFGT